MSSHFFKPDLESLIDRRNCGCRYRPLSRAGALHIDTPSYKCQAEPETGRPVTEERWKRATPPPSVRLQPGRNKTERRSEAAPGKAPRAPWLALLGFDS